MKHEERIAIWQENLEQAERDIEIAKTYREYALGHIRYLGWLASDAQVVDESGVEPSILSPERDMPWENNPEND